MLQVVRISFTILMTLSVCSCRHLDIKGMFMPTGDKVDSRFEQSSRMNEDLCAGVIEAGDDYAFYVATDPHVDKTHANLTVFNDISF